VIFFTVATANDWAVITFKNYLRIWGIAHSGSGNLNYNFLWSNTDEIGSVVTSGVGATAIINNGNLGASAQVGTFTSVFFTAPVMAKNIRIMKNTAPGSSYITLYFDYGTRSKTNFRNKK